MGVCNSKASARGARYAADDASNSSSATEAVVFAFQHKGAVSDVHAGLEVDGLVSAGAEDAQVVSSNVRTGELQRSLLGHESAVTRVDVHRVTGLLASASRDKSIRLWKSGAKDAVHILRGHELSVSAISFSEDGAQLVSGSRDTSVSIWDLERSAQVMKALKAQNVVTCIKWLPSATSSASPSTAASAKQSVFLQGAEDLCVRLWDTRSGSLKEVNRLEGYVYFPLDIDVSDDGRYALTSSKGFNSVGCEVRLWDLRHTAAPTSTLSHPYNAATAQPLELRQYTGHAQDASACIFANQSIGGKNLIISASKDGSIRLWDQDCDDSTSSARPGSNTSECLLEHREPGSGAFTSLTMMPPGHITTAEGPCFAASSYNSGVFVYEIQKDCTLKLLARSAVAPE